MTFALSAQKLCGQCAVALGWRPHEFWASTPVELACVLNALTPGRDNPAGAEDLNTLMELHPDG